MTIFQTMTRFLLMMHMLFLANDLHANNSTGTENEVRREVLGHFFRQTGTKIYDLDFVLDSPEFKKATTEEQRESILARKFEEHKKGIFRDVFQKNLKSYSLRFIGITISAMTILASYWAIKEQFLINSKATDPIHSESILTKLQNDPFARAMGGVLGAGFSLQFLPVTFPELSIIKWLQNMIFSSKLAYDPKQADFSKINEIELKFARRYHIFKKNRPDILEQMKKKLAQLWKSTLETQLDKQDLANTNTWMKHAQNLPFGTAKLQFCSEFFGEYFGTYPEAIQIRMKEYIQKQIIFSKARSKIKRVYPLYLVGKPGTGKTYAAKGLAKCLGVPMISMNITGIQSEADLYGEGEGQGYGNQSRPGRILDAYGIKDKDDPTVIPENSVLFIDEFDRAIETSDWSGRKTTNQQVIGVLLKFLEPTSGGDFESPYLGVKVATPKIIVLAGNSKPQDSALQSRFEFVEFPDFTREDKLKLLITQLLPKICADHEINPAELTDKERKQIEAVIEENLDEPGVRKLELDLDNLFMRILTERLVKDEKEALKST